MNIHVKDEEPPRVISCPQSFEDTLSRGQMLKKVRYKDTLCKIIILIPIFVKPWPQTLSPQTQKLKNQGALG